VIDVTLAACDRLAGALSSRFAVIGNVADFEAIAGLPRALPAAYVLPLIETAGPQTAMGESVQEHECTFGVTIVVRHAGDASGARAVNALGPLRDAVSGVLTGWQPPDCMSLVAFVSGQLVDFQDGATIWRDDFAVKRLVRRTASRT
jgi:hypothetical protein